MNLRSAWWGLLVIGAMQAGLGAASVPTRLDPLLDMVAADTDAMPQLSQSLHLGKSAAGEVLASVLIKATDVAVLQRSIAMAGGTIHTVAGNIVTAVLPVSQLRLLADDPVVTYIEADKPLTPKLNQSVPAVQGDSVNTTAGAAAASLPQAYTGSGVVVGVIDSGIDCLHSDFRDGSGNARILAYWDQTSGTSGVAEMTGSTGTEYTGTQLVTACSAAADATADGGHGTHVAGIMASGHSTYRGVAPDATLVVVKNAPSDAKSSGNFATTVIDGVNYIFRKAAAQSPQMPAVVNLSLGSSLGAHDGTSLFEQSLDSLLQVSDADKQGRAIVNAAGNENLQLSDAQVASFGGIHATISQTSAQQAYDFVIRDSSVMTAYGGAQVDVWLNAGSTCTLQVDAFALNNKTTVRIDMNAVSAGDSTAGSVNTDDSLQIALNFTDNNNANNGKQHAVVTITRPTGATLSATGYSFDLILLGTCTGDAWLYPDQTALVGFRKTSALPVTTNQRGYTYVSGDSLRTITIPATANKVLAVASFAHTATYTDSNSNPQTLSGVTAGAISDFSSLGPTADARVKPDLAAPGEPIISSLASTVASSYGASEKGDSTHVALRGTSMSAPHVAGAIALMLQRNGCLTSSQIRSALQSTATTDSFTGTSLPDTTWGYGKMNVLAAVRAVTAATCVPSNSNETGAGTGAVALTEGGGSSDDSTEAADSVSSGGGSCSLTIERP